MTELSIGAGRKMKGRKIRSGVEPTPNPLLKIILRVTQLPKRKSRKNRSRKNSKQITIPIGRTTPIVHPQSFCEKPRLFYGSHSKFVLMLGTGGGTFLARVDDVGDFLFDVFEFRTFSPDFNPIDAMVEGADISDSGVEDEFCDVGGWWTICTSRTKVFDDGLTIAPQRTKVITIASRGKSKDPIELFD